MQSIEPTKPTNIADAFHTFKPLSAESTASLARAQDGKDQQPAPRRWFFALPIFQKVLIANSAVILVGATMGTFLATKINQPGGPAILISFVAAGWVISVIINYVLLKIAFYPLYALRETMNQVQHGNVRLRATTTGQDPEADQFATTFNTMLEALEQSAKSRATQILSAQEQERKRIARELHDETSQSLTYLLLSLALLEKNAESLQVKEQIADIRARTHQTLRDIRNLSLDLRPNALDDLGLIPALRGYCKEYEKKFHIPVEFSATGLKERLAADLETALYRIVQEAMTNIAKHARASKIQVALKEFPATIQATVEDDGIGFNVEAIMSTPWQERGLGLAGMRERATLLGGTCQFEAIKPHGTRVSVTLPKDMERDE